MRLFVALDLPADLRRRLAALVGSLRAGLPDANWVRPEAVHLTLAFLGERPEDEAPLLRAALVPVFARHAPFVVQVGGAGVFPRRREARVLWLGLDGGSALEELQREVAERVHEVLSLEPEGRPFRPHLTLGRCRRPWPARAVRRFEESAQLEAELLVDHGSLIESTLSPDGSVYEEVARFPLGGRAERGLPAEV